MIDTHPHGRISWTNRTGHPVDEIQTIDQQSGDRRVAEQKSSKQPTIGYKKIQQPDTSGYNKRRYKKIQQESKLLLLYICKICRNREVLIVI